MITSKLHLYPAALLSLGLCVPAPVAAFTDDAGLCRAPDISQITPDTFSKDGKTHLQADKAEITADQHSHFTGNVLIQQANKRIESDYAEYLQPSEKVHAKGNVSFTAAELRIQSQQADIDLKNDFATLLNAHFQSTQNRAHGTAEKIETSRTNILELTDATYTTCDPEQVDWLLSASNITLDNNTHQGSASHVVLRFKDVPFLYLPYLRFPIGEERLSGFLFPTLGDSDKHGIEFQLPYYWNIHPQMDATLSPWYMSERGTMLQSEFRYLTGGSEGTIKNDYLEKDEQTNSKRERWYWLHKSMPGLGWRSDAEINYVADDTHLIDFTSGIESNTKDLLRVAGVTYDAQKWTVNIKGEEHQILSGIEPYKRVPQITMASLFSQTDNTINHQLNAELVRFDHNQTRVIGDRVDLQYQLNWPLKHVAGFLKPQLTLQHTSYNLQQTSGDTEISRTVPKFTLDSGLFFERDVNVFDVPFVQTLEPQLFYVYVPYRDQSNIPVFDTTIYDFNVNTPFADYRFNGIDRIGDDNRITAALATRFIDAQDGKEVFMGRIGQIFYFDDREVQLPGTAANTKDKSHLIAEIKTQPSTNWSISSQLEWDPEDEETENSSNNISYVNGKKFSLSLGQRFQRNTLDTQELNLGWQLNPNWSVIGKYLYDVKQDHILETRLGLDYDSCCWGLRITADEYFSSATLETEKVVYVSLLLKGLGYLGRSR